MTTLRRVLRLVYALPKHLCLVGGIVGGLLWAQNVGIGTATPQQRLHVNGKIIAHDGLTGAPTPSTWGSNGSRLILRPGSTTTYPHELGVSDTALWFSVPVQNQFSFYRGGHEQFAITPTTRGLARVGTDNNYPSIWLGRVNGGRSLGPYPKRGTFVFFGGPTNDFENNTDPAFMYFVHIGNDLSRLRLHVEDNTGTTPLEGFSILGGSCAVDCCNITHSNLIFDFVADGNAYKPGGGSWATLSDRRAKRAVRPYTRGLAELRQLRPVSYQYDEKFLPAFKDNWYTGLIAQEAQEVLPEIVHPYKMQVPGDRLEEVLAVNPGDLVYLLINAVKELDAENTQLRERVRVLEAEHARALERLQLLEARLESLERRFGPYGSAE